ncbi:hypothetical protein BDY24DRAFT_197129 [Mrakia frigida]|uniref:uncharacterized protein n=1 Tax=Mrakia frigida TaxID=29902 RepID=UPI003FCC22ED
MLPWDRDEELPILGSCLPRSQKHRFFELLSLPSRLPASPSNSSDSSSALTLCLAQDTQESIPINRLSQTLTEAWTNERAALGLETLEKAPSVASLFLPNANIKLLSLSDSLLSLELQDSHSFSNAIFHRHCRSRLLRSLLRPCRRASSAGSSRHQQSSSRSSTRRRSPGRGDDFRPRRSCNRNLHLDRRA